MSLENIVAMRQFPNNNLTLNENITKQQFFYMRYSNCQGERETGFLFNNGRDLYMLLKERVVDQFNSVYTILL